MSGFDMSLGFSLSQRLEQRLTLEQRLGQFVRLQLAALRGIAGENFRADAVCPNCRKSLTLGQIMKGFRRDPQDTTTKCPKKKCGHRFTPRLVDRTSHSSVEIPFFCPNQTLSRLTGLESLVPDELKRQHPAVFHSAIVHFGGLPEAFGRIGVKYTHRHRKPAEKKAWQKKVGAFLGQLPDSFVAGCVGVSLSTIRRYRQSHGIAGYRRGSL